ncbi:ribulose-phosphate 3-epimerase [Sporolactobacillus shoreicorticis]|uniref:Ribulose-phosphate 3-epimerase n=1 Tax=Sporolactobacillus shoreicorticis TaxID=1923877 RepID=A0ABW5S430_9BACL|nr:ribulose-phosphate 3-epimerase [Sporolactobacillus shoreicorticis]MCO7124271.1 ribulose-phosphate 3-epimerase [Sporolactobacillus shoreicorticis]
MQRKLYPSMMCAGFNHLSDEVEQLSAAAIDGFHMDIMDGSFVPNFGMSPEDFKTVADHADKMLDVHLMIDHPERYVAMFVTLGAKRVYFHPEATPHSARIISQIKQIGAEAGIAINPGTSIASISELLPLVDQVLVMTVNPGFAGQEYLEFVTGKIKQLSRIRRDYHFEIVVDGAISPEKINELNPLGVTGFVLGTSALFGKGKSYNQIIRSLKEQQEA